MSDIRTQENAIIYFGAKKLVSIGVDASKLVVDGDENASLISDGKILFTLFKAYRKKIALADTEIDALLYCIRKLSGENEFPTTSPIVGFPLNYVLGSSYPSNSGHWVDQGDYDASTNMFPATDVLRGYTWNISVAGILAGVSVEPGATIRAKTNSPGQVLLNWDIKY